MRTIKHILITGCIALAVSSCDYLDQQPYEYWQPEETFIDYYCCPLKLFEPKN